ncbi:MAG: hypothetical protein Q9195_000633 [Heterodermia aff. obscurata]
MPARSLLRLRLPFRPSLPSDLPLIAKVQLPLCLRLAQRRYITAEEKPLPETDGKRPGHDHSHLPHVSEEAAAIGKVTGEGGPDIEEQGTPVQEVLNRDEKAEEKKPEVLKEKPDSKVPTGVRTFSTMARQRADALVAASQDSDVESQGHIFGLPELPLPSNARLKYRYEPVVQQITGLIMRSGKLGVAQRNTAMILNHLRTASPPTFNPDRPLIPGAPPASQLPLNPVLYMTLAIDSVAPLFRIRSQRGAAGGGVALQIPVPLTIRQRRRQAFMWILNAASKRRTRGSGRGGFAQKVAEELIAVVEGRSGVWDRRGGIHKLGVAARANLKTRRR